MYSGFCPLGHLYSGDTITFVLKKKSFIFTTAQVVFITVMESHFNCTSPFFNPHQLVFSVSSTCKMAAKHFVRSFFAVFIILLAYLLCLDVLYLCCLRKNCVTSAMSPSLITETVLWDSCTCTPAYARLLLWLKWSMSQNIVVLVNSLFSWGKHGYNYGFITTAGTIWYGLNHLCWHWKESRRSTLYSRSGQTRFNCSSQLCLSPLLLPFICQLKFCSC